MATSPHNHLDMTVPLEKHTSFSLLFASLLCVGVAQPHPQSNTDRPAALYTSMTDREQRKEMETAM